MVSGALVREARFFHVPAREMLFAEPVLRPFLPVLVFDGVAVTTREQHYLVLTLRRSARFYVGPDTPTVARRASVVEAALRDGRPRLEQWHASLVRHWVEEAWEALLDELVEERPPLAGI